MQSEFGPLVVFEIPIPFTDIIIPITETVTVTWWLILFIFIACILVTRNFEKIPKRVQNVVEMLVETITNLTKTTMGEGNVSFAPYVGTLLIFLAIANTIGIIGIRPPTADLNTTMALSVLTFFLIHINGSRANGVGGHLKSLTEPVAFLTPINLIGEIATPISLGFRLFGNIVGGMIIMSLVYSLLAYLSTLLFGTFGQTVPVFQFGIPIVLHCYFDLFAGLLQSFIFAMLTMVNVASAID